MHHQKEHNGLPTSCELLSYLGWHMGWISSRKKIDLVPVCPVKRQQQENLIKDELINLLSEGYDESVRPFLQAYYYQFYRFFNESSNYLNKEGFERQDYFHSWFYPYIARLASVLEIFRLNNSPTFLSTFVEMLTLLMAEDEDTKKPYTLNKVFNLYYWRLVPKEIQGFDSIIQLKSKYSKGNYASDIKFRNNSKSLFEITIESTIKKFNKIEGNYNINNKDIRVKYAIIRKSTCIIKALSQWFFEDEDWPRRKLDKKLFINKEQSEKIKHLFNNLVPNFSSIYSFRKEGDMKLSASALITHIISKEAKEQIETIEKNWPIKVINDTERNKMAYSFWLLTLNPLFGPATEAYKSIQENQKKITNNKSNKEARAFLNSLILDIHGEIKESNGEISPIENLRYIHKKLSIFEGIPDNHRYDEIKKEHLPKLILEQLNHFNVKFQLEEQVCYLGILAFGFSLRGQCFTSPTHFIPWQSILPIAFKKITPFSMTNTIFGFQRHSFEKDIDRFNEKYLFFENLVNCYNRTLRKITDNYVTLNSLYYNPFHDIFKKYNVLYTLYNEIKDNFRSECGLDDMSRIYNLPKDLYDCKVFGYYNLDPYLLLVLSEDYLVRFGFYDLDHLDNSEFAYDKDFRFLILKSNIRFKDKFKLDLKLSSQRSTLTL